MEGSAELLLPPRARLSALQGGRHADGPGRDSGGVGRGARSVFTADAARGGACVSRILSAKAQLDVERENIRRVDQLIEGRARGAALSRREQARHTQAVRFAPCPTSPLVYALELFGELLDAELLCSAIELITREATNG